MAEITLQSPVQRKDETIDQIHLRRPAAGELRGLSLAQLMQMNVDAILKLVPRITAPALLEHEVAALDPVDFSAIAQEVVGFFFSEAQKAEIEAEMTTS